MKTSKRFLSIVLALVLMLSITVPVFAASAEEPTFNYYFMIGDSVALKCKNEHSDRSGYLRFSEGSYAELIAKHYNIPAGYNCAHTGWRTHEGRIAIDPSYEGDIYTTDWEYRWGSDTLAQMQKNQAANIAALQKADLVTVNFGSNNLIGVIAYSAAKVFEDENAGTPFERQAIEAINAAIEENSDIAIIATILEAAKKLGQVKIVIDTVIADLIDSLEEYADSWNNLITSIRNVNPDATLVVLGMYNAIGSDVRFVAEENGIPGDSIALLADALDDMTKPPVQYINYVMKNSSLNDEYIYVDNSNADLTGSFDGSHMGPIGHAKTAEKIIAALNKDYQDKICQHENTTLTNVKAATKLSKGYSGDLVCADCGELLEKGTATAFHCDHEHTKLVGAIPATRFTLGFTGTLFCSDCGKLLDISHVIGFLPWTR